MTQPKIDWESLGKEAGTQERNPRPGHRTRPPDWTPRREQPVKDLLGKSFGLITVVRQSVSDGHGSRWMCRCECGAERILRRAEIVKGVKTHRSCKESA